jgi:hypothetical protein
VHSPQAAALDPTDLKRSAALEVDGRAVAAPAAERKDERDDDVDGDDGEEKGEEAPQIEVKDDAAHGEANDDDTNDHGERQADHDHHDADGEPEPEAKSGEAHAGEERAVVPVERKSGRLVERKSGRLVDSSVHLALVPRKLSALSALSEVFVFGQKLRDAVLDPFHTDPRVQLSHPLCHIPIHPIARHEAPIA